MWYPQPERIVVLLSLLLIILVFAVVGGALGWFLYSIGAEVYSIVSSWEAVGTAAADGLNALGEHFSQLFALLPPGELQKRLTGLYRQSRMAGNLENTGWAKPGFVCAYNIFTMDETETVLACGAGGVSKLKDPYSEDLTRIFNFKYSYEYISRYGEILKRKEGIGRQYEQFRKRIR